MVHLVLAHVETVLVGDLTVALVLRVVGAQKFEDLKLVPELFLLVEKFVTQLLVGFLNRDCS